MSNRAQSIVTVTERRDENAHHVALRGRLEVTTVPDVRLTMHRLLDDGSNAVHLDLEECRIADSTALGLLIECLRRARRHGRPLHVVAADPSTERLLRRARLGNILGAGEPATVPSGSRPAASRR